MFDILFFCLYHLFHSFIDYEKNFTPKTVAHLIGCDFTPFNFSVKSHLTYHTLFGVLAGTMVAHQIRCAIPT